ncbi:lactonase family protein [Sporomusa acidovorans]|uniref:6-phosphogluconolactonase n=1 Tax=Sporomusa acidovorans (strain ATCC 49682 / DSM 3132 / Mol) TaxID=1123286 RepID=A0ABZ3J2K3_SPOA4|nr:beta-propeller fold lactonase family protein [Sporomusa acidovorans]OZC24143.1 6-phosphogluconolactonase [Sporomusa acidovorans DSM 3132]SDF37116.1 6-phosphogluconolactonase, cycloisomerase 2 family [Sporomusa acidovorans]
MKLFAVFVLILSISWFVKPAFVSAAAQMQSEIAVYTSLGEELSRYELDVPNATLTKKGSIRLAANVQFAAFHPNGHYLYVVSSNAGNGTLGAAGNTHLLSVFKIDKTNGGLQAYGEPVILPERPIHITVDKSGNYALVAFNQSGTVRVYRILRDGAIGEEVPQPQKPDGGIFTHQVMVTSTNNTVIALGRGNEAVQSRPADIGSRTTFSFSDGVLTQVDKTYYEQELGPRHLAFHPTKPWVYVAMERGSKLQMHTLKDGILSKEPLYQKETLNNLEYVHKERQKGGVVKIHPNGKYLYVTNRADGTIKENGQAVIWAGGENNIAVFKLDETSGEPTLIQHIDCGGIEARTFAIDPSGKLLVAANQKTMQVKTGDTLKTVPANLSVFRIGDDGKLAFVRQYDVNAGSKWLLWMDLIEIK